MSLLPAVVLLAALVALVGLAAATARPPDVAIPPLDEHLRRWSSLHAGIDPRANRLVGGWLRLMHLLGRPLARRGVLPDVVTLLGLWWAAAVVVLCLPGGRWPLVAAFAVVLGGIADGLDGTVAVLTGRATPWGGVLDAVVDRLADLLLLGALWVLGAPAAVVVTAAAALYTLEYLRARADERGAQLTVITVGERATRIVLVGVAVWCAGLLPASAGAIAGTGAGAVVVVALVGCAQLAVAARRSLT